MSDELKPCPFCGNEVLAIMARRLATYEPDNIKTVTGVAMCADCGAEMRVNLTVRLDMPDDMAEEEIRRELRERWNARAVVTDGQFSTAVHDGAVWQMVRECEWRSEHDDEDFVTECGAMLIWEPPAPLYCPNCGGHVKVIDRDDRDYKPDWCPLVPVEAPC